MYVLCVCTHARTNTQTRRTPYVIHIYLKFLLSPNLILEIFFRFFFSVFFTALAGARYYPTVINAASDARFRAETTLDTRQGKRNLLKLIIERRNYNISSFPFKIIYHVGIVYCAFGEQVKYFLKKKKKVRVVLRTIEYRYYVENYRMHSMQICIRRSRKS